MFRLLFQQYCPLVVIDGVFKEKKNRKSQINFTTKKNIKTSVSVSEKVKHKVDTGTNTNFCFENHDFTYPCSVESRDYPLENFIFKSEFPKNCN